MLTEMIRSVTGSVDELVRGASSREPMKTADSLSGASFERVVIDGERFVLKYLHVDDDWIQRATGDLTCLPVRIWASGILDRVSDVIDDAVVAASHGPGRNGWGYALLMRDYSGSFVPEGSDVIPLEQHLRFVEHMAALHAAYWGFQDTIGLAPFSSHYLALSEITAEIEDELGSGAPVPKMLPGGWRRFAADAPRSAAIVLPLLRDSMPLVEALQRTPQTLVHCDWKLGNLGSHPDGRTILVDWAWTAQAPACRDIAWYLAVNCDRMPQSKEAAIDAYRAALESRGIATAGWFQPQLELCLLGSLVQLGWSKAGEELAWWDERAPGWARHLSAG